jgi:hypothetical protein
MVTRSSFLLPSSLVLNNHGHKFFILLPLEYYLRRLPMGGLGLLLFNLLKEFTLFYIFIFLGEWFVERRGYNLFERAWIITMIALVLLTFIAWRSLGRYLLFL